MSKILVYEENFQPFYVEDNRTIVKVQPRAKKSKAKRKVRSSVQPKEKFWDKEFLMALSFGTCFSVIIYILIQLLDKIY